MKLLNFKKVALPIIMLAFGGVLTVSADAQTVNVNVNGVNYTVGTTPYQSYSLSAANPAYGLTSQPWWSNGSLANSFASAVGNRLGYWNSPTGSGPTPTVLFVSGTSGSATTVSYTTNGSLVQAFPGNGPGISLAAIYAYILGYVPASGPSTYNTQSSIQNTANALQGIYSLQNAALTNSFTYDCTEYGANNICVSAGGRNTAVAAANGLNNTSGLLILGYRPAPNYRVGVYADQNLWVNQANSGVSLGNNTPLMGLFGVWSEELDGTGTEVKVSAAYGQKNTTITRGLVGSGATASEAGAGGSQLNSQGAQVSVKYGFNVMQDVNVAPYAGVRYTQNNMAGYSEQATSAVTAPLTYGALYTNATTALLGVGASYKGIPQTTVFASAGYESDTNTGYGTYSGYSSSISGLTPVNFNPNPIKNRPTASLGAAYQIEKNQSLGVTGIYRQEAYQAISTTTVMATYTAGF